MCGGRHLLLLYAFMAWKATALTLYCFQIDVNWNSALNYTTVAS